jgi:hypothetical protein
MREKEERHAVNSRLVGAQRWTASGKNQDFFHRRAYVIAQKQQKNAGVMIPPETIATVPRIGVAFALWVARLLFCEKRLKKHKKTKLTEFFLKSIPFRTQLFAYDLFV